MLYENQVHSQRSSQQYQVQERRRFMVSGKIQNAAKENPARTFHKRNHTSIELHFLTIIVS